MRKPPTRLELRNACLDAFDFMSTNMDGADDECQDKYEETMRVLRNFHQKGKLSRMRRTTQSKDGQS